MPMYFGYKAHHEHCVPWQQPRSGKQMQGDPGYALKWSKLKQEAEGSPELKRLIDALRDKERLSSEKIVQAIEGQSREKVVQIRRRQQAFELFKQKEAAKLLK